MRYVGGLAASAVPLRVHRLIRRSQTAMDAPMPTAPTPADLRGLRSLGSANSGQFSAGTDSGVAAPIGWATQNRPIWSGGSTRAVDAPS
jgi:hypothetical protein